MSSDDVLWRRTKLGLHYTPAEREQVAIWLQAHAKNNNAVEVEVS